VLALNRFAANPTLAASSSDHTRLSSRGLRLYTKLVSGGVDGSIRVWELPSGKESLVLPGHKHGVACLALTADGNSLASAGLGEQERGATLSEVGLWDVQTGKGKSVLRASERENMVSSVAFSPDGARLATAHLDGTVNLWSVKQLRRR
jgi:WD40 repeat protein